MTLEQKMAPTRHFLTRNCYQKVKLLACNSLMHGLASRQLDHGKSEFFVSMRAVEDIWPMCIDSYVMSADLLPLRCGEGADRRIG